MAGTVGADFKNTWFFPDLERIDGPGQGTPFYDEEGDYWCLLAQINEADFLLRPRLVVTDRQGNEFVVALYHDRRQDERLVPRKFKPGHTIAIVLAEYHMFMDGSHGVRVEDLDTIA